MSKTDKDRPDWVMRFDTGTTVEHDHRGGECIVERLDDARYEATRRTRMTTHRRGSACPAWAWVEYSCGGEFVRVRLDDEWGIWRGAGYLRFVCGFTDATDATRWLARGCADGIHRRLEPTGEHCGACAEHDRHRVTCYHRRDNDSPYWRRYRPRGASDLVNLYVERPACRRARRSLRDATRDWNTHGDTDVDVEPATTRGASRIWW